MRLRADLDDDRAAFAEETDWIHGLRGSFFGRKSRIVVAPGDAEVIRLGFLTVDGSWCVNCDLKYVVAGQERHVERLLGQGVRIVNYRPDLLENDYCSFKELVDPGYPKFDNAGYYMVASEGESLKEAKSRRNLARDYLEGMLNV